MDLALLTYKGWYAMKPNQPTNQTSNQRKDSIDWQYVWRNEAGRDFTSIEDCIKSSIEEFVDYIKSKERRISEARNMRADEKQQKPESGIGKRNKFKRISSDKLTKLHMKKTGYSYERETWANTQNSKNKLGGEKYETVNPLIIRHSKLV